MRIWPGKPYPLGATYDGVGTNFSVFSEIAERIELCLFDDDGKETRIDLPETTGFCWHGYFPEVSAGRQLSGSTFTARGPLSKGIAATQPNCYWILIQKHLKVRSIGMRVSFHIISKNRMEAQIQLTVPLSCPDQW